MTTTEQDTRTIRIYRVYIKATPEAIWEALTSPDWNSRFGYGIPTEYELQPGGAMTVHRTEEMIPMGMPEVVVDGEIIELDPPHRLVQTYRFNFMPDQTAEGFTTLTYEIEPDGKDMTRLTIIHDLTDAPLAADMVAGDGRVGEGGGGWPWILSSLKTLLETGESVTG